MVPSDEQNPARLDAVLATSRAFGNFRFKDSSHEPGAFGGWSVFIFIFLFLGFAVFLIVVFFCFVFLFLFCLCVASKLHVFLLFDFWALVSFRGHVFFIFIFRFRGHFVCCDLFSDGFLLNSFPWCFVFFAFWALVFFKQEGVFSLSVFFSR